VSCNQEPVIKDLQKANFQDDSVLKQCSENNKCRLMLMLTRKKEGNSAIWDNGDEPAGH
jgi:hypothetical protein